MMDRTGVVATMSRADPLYPTALRQRLGSEAPEYLAARGHLPLLTSARHAIFCSTEPPPDLVLTAVDLARDLSEGSQVAVGGFQSAVEKLVLEVLLKERHPVVVLAARSISTMRLPSPWVAPIADGRLLLVSAMHERRRADRATAAMRNRVAAALADAITVVHAAPGGSVYRLMEEVLRWGIPVRYPLHPANEALGLIGGVEWTGPVTSGTKRAHPVEGHEQAGTHVGGDRHPQGSVAGDGECDEDRFGDQRDGNIEADDPLRLPGQPDGDR
jgi:hypothetical protein